MKMVVATCLCCVGAAGRHGHGGARLARRSLSHTTVRPSLGFVIARGPPPPHCRQRGSSSVISPQTRRPLLLQRRWPSSVPLAAHEEHSAAAASSEEAPVRTAPRSSLWLRDAASLRAVPAVENSDDATLRWYACGPTVYDAAHLGHARTYVTLDILRRAATKWAGIDVDFAMGVTDIDDKIIDRARRAGIDWFSLARAEETEFFNDMRRLGCEPPTRVLRVTEHIDDIIKYVENIIENGFAYKTADGVWFDVAKLGDAYGAFAEGRGTSRAAAQAASSSDDDATRTVVVNDEAVDASALKRDPRDFALWKAAKSKDEPAWDAVSLGRGRPGWHIECSAMIQATFSGAALDLHAGGVDLAFPHHENEIAQWRGAKCALYPSSSSDFCKCWFHTGHLHIEGRKMSKSLKNFITIKDVLADGTIHPEDFRIFCAAHRYRSTVNYARRNLAEARAVRLELKTALLAAKDALAKSRSSKTSAFSSDDDDDDDEARQTTREEQQEGEHLLTTTTTTTTPSKGRLPPHGGENVFSKEKRFEATETELVEQLHKTKRDVRRSLLDDLDTPTAVASLQKLAARVRGYAVSRGGASEECVPEPLIAAATYLAETLRDLGLPETADAWFLFSPASFHETPTAFDQKHQAAAASSFGGDAAANLADDDVLDALVAFRSRVRAAALDKTPPSGDLKQLVLTLCDELRDAPIFKKRGVAIVDRPDGTAHLAPALEYTLAGDDAPDENETQKKKPKSPPPKGKHAQYVDVPPAELFKVGEFEGKYSAFDEAGLPTRDADGAELSKSMRKKLKKRFDAHTLKWSGRAAAANAVSAPPVAADTTTTATRPADNNAPEPVASGGF